MLGEVTNTRVREKTSLLACSISIVVTFLTSFTMPYLLNPGYAGLGGKVGFVYGSLCFGMNVAAYLVVPEMKGRSLEEIDALFAAGVPLRRFRGAVLPEEAAPAATAASVSGCEDDEEKRRSEKKDVVIV